MRKRTEAYGRELILDLCDCNSATFVRHRIYDYFVEICEEIDMERADLHFWDDVGVPEDEKQTEPHLKGTSAIQFIMTSNITIHTLDLLGKVFINLFSCKDFDKDAVERISLKHFGGRIVKSTEIERV